MTEPEGQVVYGVWEVNVDGCEFCDELATEATVEIDPVRMVLRCPEHAELFEAESGRRMRPGGATCAAMLDHGAPCGAVTTHVKLIGFYEAGEPQLAFWALCRAHALDN